MSLLVSTLSWRKKKIIQFWRLFVHIHLSLHTSRILQKINISFFFSLTFFSALLSITRTSSPIMYKKIKQMKSHPNSIMYYVYVYIEIEYDSLFPFIVFATVFILLFLITFSDWKCSVKAAYNVVSNICLYNGTLCLCTV